MNGKFKTLFSLFMTFLKIGAFTFGGGYAMVAVLQNEFVTKKKWLTAEEFLDMIAIAESTPGPVAINSATYIGYKTAGIAGGILSTAAVTVPSFAVIYIISLFYDSFSHLTFVQYAFKGIRACIIYLILKAGIKLFRSIPKNTFNCVVFAVILSAVILLTLFAVDFSSIYCILICGTSGVAVYLIQKLKTRQRKGGKV